MKHLKKYWRNYLGLLLFLNGVLLAINNTDHVIEVEEVYTLGAIAGILVGIGAVLILDDRLNKEAREEYQSDHNKGTDPKQS